MKQFFFAALAAATAVCSSCTDRDETLQDSFTPLQVSVSDGGPARSIHQETSFAAGSTLGVSLFAADGTPYEGLTSGYANVSYVSEILTGMGGG